jgi:hypothetical protein
MFAGIHGTTYAVGVYGALPFYIACYYLWRGCVKRNWMRHAYVKRAVATVTGKPIENVRKAPPARRTPKAVIRYGKAEFPEWVAGS